MKSKPHIDMPLPISGKLLKREWIRRQIYPTKELARSDVFHYIEMFCNTRRLPGTAESRLR
jgi:putative transposase